MKMLSFLFLVAINSFAMNQHPAKMDNLLGKIITCTPGGVGFRGNLNENDIKKVKELLENSKFLSFRIEGLHDYGHPKDVTVRCELNNKIPYEHNYILISSETYDSLIELNGYTFTELEKENDLVFMLLGHPKEILEENKRKFEEFKRKILEELRK